MVSSTPSKLRAQQETTDGRNAGAGQLQFLDANKSSSAEVKAADSADRHDQTGPAGEGGGFGRRRARQGRVPSRPSSSGARDCGGRLVGIAATLLALLLGAAGYLRLRSPGKAINRAREDLAAIEFGLRYGHAGTRCWGDVGWYAEDHQVWHAYLLLVERRIKLR